MINFFYDILPWVMNGLAACGSWLTGNKQEKVNLFLINSLFLISNLYSLTYFFLTDQWSFFGLQIFFAISSLRGVINNRPIRNKEIKTISELKSQILNSKKINV